MYRATKDVEIVKRFGRWASSSFSPYLWELRDATKGLTEGMLKSVGRLEATHGLGAEVAARQEKQRRVRFVLPHRDPAASGEE